MSSTSEIKTNPNSFDIWETDLEQSVESEANFFDALVPKLGTDAIAAQLNFDLPAEPLNLEPESNTALDSKAENILSSSQAIKNYELKDDWAGFDSNQIFRSDKVFKALRANPVVSSTSNLDLKANISLNSILDSGQNIQQRVFANSLINFNSVIPQAISNSATENNSLDSTEQYPRQSHMPLSCGCFACGSPNQTLSSRSSNSGLNSKLLERNQNNPTSAAAATLALAPEVEMYAPEANIDPNLPNALIDSGAPVWGNPFGPDPGPTQITYSFRGNAEAMNADQVFWTGEALKTWEAVADIVFVYDSTGNGQISFGITDLGEDTAGRQDGTVGQEVDVWLNNNSKVTNDDPSYLNPSRGTNAFHTLIHEIGHALGLKHPGNYNGSDGTADPPYLDVNRDTWRNTVMSYNGTGGNGTHFNGTNVAPETPMLYDMVAITHLYDRNPNYNTIDNVYSWNTNDAFFATIWDMGGTDYISASTQANSVEINLNPGSYSSIGPQSNGATDRALGNLGIGFSWVENFYFYSWIENAIGSLNRDTIEGNILSNQLYGLEGDDYIDGYSSSVANYTYSDGKDSLYGAAGIDLLRGGTDDDSLFGGADDDQLEGEAGNDYLTDLAYESATVDDASNDLMIGGAGKDSLIGGGGNDTLIGDNGRSDGSTGIAFGDDFLAGGAGNDSLSGEAGNELLYGEDGNDTLLGSFGRDTLFGGFGDDSNRGGYDDDLILDAAGNDTLNGGNGSDTLYGGDDDDHLIGGDVNANLDGSNLLYGEGGNDSLVGGRGASDTLYGGIGNDTLEAGIGAALLDGGDDNDYLDGGQSSDRLFGGAGKDILLGFIGNDTLNGGDNDDNLYGDFGSDRMDGGNGNDFQFGDFGFDTLYGEDGKDTLVGGEHDDTLYGDIGDDMLFGDSGNDFLSGDRLFISGNDTLSGGLGKDTLYGWDGNDSLDGGSDHDSLSGGGGDDIVKGGEGDDFFYSDLGNDTLNGGTGTDRLQVSASSGGFDLRDMWMKHYDSNQQLIETDILTDVETVSLTGDEGSNWFYAYFFTKGSVSLFGAGGVDKLYGGSGDDTLNGGEGNDVLQGRQGSDYLTGQGGSDIIAGMEGNDILIGGDANDVFGLGSSTAFSTATSEVDRIVDFGNGPDHFVLTKSVFSALKSQGGIGFTVFGFSVASEFAVVATDAAVATSQAIIAYSQGTGNLFYNQNGTASGLGAGGQFATLVGAPELVATDFIIQA
ncbi:MAG: matrixin family metalloprotease [Aphanocapsa sp. GSE-SYN-MK-11-07L]|nr:matrixin family metalloprotease [Aphanocapsa sp. GSE-SYN-MK-11-07L]